MANRSAGRRQARFTLDRGSRFAALVLAALVMAALAAPWLAVQDPFDPAAFDLGDALLPPAWLAAGDRRFLFGTDDQGRDLLSAMLFGLRLSLLVGLSSVLLGLLLGVSVGLVAGWVGGWVDLVAMHLADLQLTFPAMLTALMIDGIIKASIGLDQNLATAIAIIILSIGLALWVQFARAVRASTQVEAGQDYVAAARIAGRPAAAILGTHILPNIAGPILVLASVSLATAVITEATLSFLGVGVPVTHPSLGTLLRTGNDFLLGGSWWIAFFPGLTLVLLAGSASMLADGLRDALDPRQP